MRLPQIVSLCMCELFMPMLAWSQATDVPVDAGVSIIAPSSETPNELAAFSGKWAGPWNGVKTGTLMQEAFFAVEEITSSTSIRVYYGHIVRFRSPVADRGDKVAGRVTGKVEDGALHFTTPDKRPISCAISAADTMACVMRIGASGENRGTFKRVN